MEGTIAQWRIGQKNLIMWLEPCAASSLMHLATMPDWAEIKACSRASRPR
jgi:hypothetical protein